MARAKVLQRTYMQKQALRLDAIEQIGKRGL
jgi:hypothetical protein